MEALRARIEGTSFAYFGSIHAMSFGSIKKIKIIKMEPLDKQDAAHTGTAVYVKSIMHIRSLHWQAW